MFTEAGGGQTARKREREREREREEQAIKIKEIKAKNPFWGAPPSGWEAVACFVFWTPPQYESVIDHCDVGIFCRRCLALLLGDVRCRARQRQMTGGGDGQLRCAHIPCRGNVKWSVWCMCGCKGCMLLHRWCSSGGRLLVRRSVYFYKFHGTTVQTYTPGIRIHLFLSLFLICITHRLVEHKEISLKTHTHTKTNGLCGTVLSAFHLTYRVIQKWCEKFNHLLLVH